MYCGVTWFDKFLEFYTKRLFLTPEGIVAVAPIIKFYFVTILKVIQMHTRIIYNIQSFIEGSHYNNGNVSSLWRIKKCISRNKLFCLIFCGRCIQYHDFLQVCNASSKNAHRNPCGTPRPQDLAHHHPSGSIRMTSATSTKHPALQVHSLSSINSSFDGVTNAKPVINEPFPSSPLIC